MSVISSRVQEQNHTAQLAAQFNQFYLDITLKEVTQIGNYRILKEIGEGAFGKVYLAQHVLLNCDVVLKCGLIDDPNIVREIYYHKQLRHKNVVKLYEVIKTETHLWMAMEYCRGNELYYYIYEKRRLDIDVCQKLFYQIADSMRYVHSLNLAHRDLKLENILMADKKRTIIKLTDFGFVREFNPYKRQFLSTMCGTTAYMAPEVLKNEKYSGFAIDVWSMGIILYAMMYGELPFDSDDEITTKFKIVNDEPVYKDIIPSSANDLLRKMLSKLPAARPTIAEILNSEFLIDTTNSMLERKPSQTHNEDESIISINQHYKKNLMPFSSKIEKHLLKKMEKLGLDIEALQSSAFCGQCNTLTAFYDLALTYEFQKKKKRYMSKKRYFDARRQLKRSSQRVKSVLSLSDQNGQCSPTVEREGMRSNSSTKLDISSIRKMLSRRSTDTGRTPGSVGGTNYFPLTPSSAAPAAMGRSVSFHPDEPRSFMSTSTQDSNSQGKVKNILEKMAFWKRGKNYGIDTNSILSSQRSRRSARSESIDGAILELNLKKPSPPAAKPELVTDHNNDYSSLPSPTTFSVADAEDGSATGIPLASSVPAENGQMVKTRSQDSYQRRQRPDSVVSQASQYSQLSQMYPMSESEFDIGTDMDDDYYDYDGVYESSINTSQQDLHARNVVLPQSASAKKKNRPANLRLPSSDNLIISTNTNATKPKRNQLSVISTNSSEESSLPLKVSDRLNDDGSFSEFGTPRSISPGTKVLHPRHPKLRGQRSSSLTKSSAPKASNNFATNSRPSPFKASANGNMVAPLPVYPVNPYGNSVQRPQSPTIEKSFNKLAINGVMKPFHKVIANTKSASGKRQDGDGQSSIPMFEINEEEEEDDERELDDFNQYPLGKNNAIPYQIQTEIN
ncbi:hypothetical protein PUMCH_004401 [Australozyma saopauloensis]|uniref:non-specific serine/threonine protein kinase n=1 Tax=Australozyma saopauloensis TaxID=291208 RepID=A0AAX4HH52_9ASCO|nr:hypothetical protein PUMCH_004401 [[Candida] saopauloensis]